MTSSRKLALLLAQANPIAAAPTWADKGAVAEALIDRNANGARLPYVPDIAGQDGVYIWKAEEAAELVAVLAAGGLPDAADYPHLSQEVGVTAPTLEGVAAAVMERRRQYRYDLSPPIEGLRVYRKSLARAAVAAQDEQALRAALIAVRPADA